MKILFIENRYRTKFWERIASKLQDDGHEIHWIVQNPMFSPNFKNVNVIKFPDSHESIPTIFSVDKIKSADRGQNYYGLQKDDYFHYYFAKIGTLLSEIRPDVAFGEATLYHELIVSQICFEYGIVYLNPTSNRLPVDRFSFYMNDTTVPFKGSEQKLSRAEGLDILNSIRRRESTPSYMRFKSGFGRKLRGIKSNITLIIGYLLGERFNTPSPTRKIFNAIRLRNLKTKWENKSTNIEFILGTRKNIVLYAMQLQPESNIDVWGFPYRNQTHIIENLIKLVDDNTIVLLKPNPKWYMEITEELLTLVEQNESKLKILSQKISMTDFFNKVDVVVTVTGTVGLESIFTNKFVIILGKLLPNNNFNAVPQSLNVLPNLIEKIRMGKVPQVELETQLDILNFLMGTSYEGIIADAIDDPQLLNSEKNIAKVVKAFKHVIDLIKVNENINSTEIKS